MPVLGDKPKKFYFAHQTVNLVMYRLAHEKKITILKKNLDFNPLPTRFNFTEFLPTSMHSGSMQHIEGEENK